MVNLIDKPVSIRHARVSTKNVSKRKVDFYVVDLPSH